MQSNHKKDTDTMIQPSLPNRLHITVEALHETTEDTCKFTSAANASHGDKGSSRNEAPSSRNLSAETCDRADYRDLVEQALIRYKQYDKSSHAKHTTEDLKRGLAERGGTISETAESRTSGAPRVDNLGASHRIVQNPRKHDILFGRSKRQKNHSGNQSLRWICDNQRMMYDRADRDDKTAMTRRIVDEIKSSGGCFLRFRKDLQAWVEVSDEEARQKVGHLIRDGRRQCLGQMNSEIFSLPRK